VLAAIGLGLIALGAWWLWRRLSGRAPAKRDGYTRYFNDEFKDGVIPSRNRIKNTVTELFQRMNAENPDWRSHPNLGAWHVEHSLGGRVESDALRASMIYALFVDAHSYDRLPAKMPFSYGTMRSLISEAIFLYRREFDLNELDRGIAERQARDQARAAPSERTAWASS
jgi:hypothetical protein